MSGVSEVMGGSISAIMSFGAFVSLEDGSSGLVHISEISKNFVKDVNEFLAIGQQVKVVVLATDHDGKKRLSMKKADEIILENGGSDINVLKAQNKDGEGRSEKKLDKPKKVKPRKDEAKLEKQNLFTQPPPEYDDLNSSSSDNFEDRLSKYMKLSEERLIDVKRQNENKRGGGYVRRG